MDRRTAFTTLFNAPKASMPNLVVTGLEPYTGAWDFAAAAHLLRRATFSPNKAMIQTALDQGLDATIAQLFSDNSLPEPPLYYDTNEDPNAGLGQTWINAPLQEDINLAPNRKRSQRAWTIGLILNEGISIKEKLYLFWINHFAIRGVNDPRVVHEYSSLIRSSAWGNIRQLLKDITINHAMLRFLNGNTNRVGNPNENYARELLELFTIGKGPIAGPGDYTNYTEEDVVAMARVLTGWRTRGYNSTNADVNPESYFQANRHDTGEKQLSHRFDNIVIQDQGEQEYSALIDVIFSKDEVARHLCRKLYRWFIYYDISESAEQEVIQPLAQMLIDNDYELQPVLATLLSSTHFFDMLNVGPMIKNPMAFVIGLFKEQHLSISDDEASKQAAYNSIYIRTRNIGMDYYDVPQVAGWKAYYQSPSYYRNWINSTSLQARNEVANRMATNGYTANGERFKLDHLSFVASLDDATDPNAMIAEIVQLLLPQPLHASQLAALKEVLIPGLPDFEWTVEYGAHIALPEDEDLRDAVESKLENLFTAIFSMAEYQLS